MKINLFVYKKDHKFNSFCTKMITIILLALTLTNIFRRISDIFDIA